MRILVLNLYYPPDTSATAKMAATVVEALSSTHQVTVLCGRPSYEPTERRTWRIWRTESVGRVRIVRVGSTTYPRFAMKRRVLNYLSYVALTVPKALFTQCDVVLAMTDPPFQGIVGAFISMLKHKPYVYNIRDLYPDMAIAGEIMKPGLLTRIWEKLHRWALRRTNLVVVLGDDMRSRIVAKGVQSQKVTVIRDGAEIPSKEAPKPAFDDEIIREIRGGGKFVLLHAGNLGFYGAWETLITAVRSLEADGISLVFVGGGAQCEQIKSCANGSKNVHFLPFFPSSKLPSVLAAPDAHVITVRRGLEGVVVPSKMYGILAAGKPILAIAPDETDAASLSEKYGFGVSADPDSPEKVTAAIRSLAMNSHKLQDMGQAARAAAPSYDRVKELQKFVETIEEAVRA